jgi:hypothetical protein
VPVRVLSGDQQGQLERVEQAELWELPRSGDGVEDVPAAECPLKDRVRTAL